MGCRRLRPSSTWAVVIALPATFAFGQSPVPEFGTAETRTLTTIATTDDGLDRPTDLAFNPDDPSQLWTVNYSYDGTVMFTDAGTDAQTADKRIDRYAAHFMAEVTSIAFGAHTFRGDGLTFATCHDTRVSWPGRRPDDFMGPTLWSADLDIYARANQTGPLLGSHIDMLHQSPECMGIAHDSENVYWVADGRNGHIVRYDFVEDHGPGHDDHSDGIVRRYVDASFTRVEGVPANLVFDADSGWLYVADTGAGRVYRLDTRSGRETRTLRPRNEPLAEFAEWGEATVQVLATDLGQPSGLAKVDQRLFVTDHASGKIIAIDIVTRSVMDVMDTGATGIGGVTVAPDGKLWYADTTGNRIVRVDP